MSASTAGVGLDPFYWLAQVATEHTGAEFCVAAAIAANPVRGTGLYGAPRDQLGRLAGVDAHNRVDPSVRTLTGEGFLELARPGGGRGIFRLFQLAQPALIPMAETSRGERPVSAKPAVENGGYRPETSRGERPVSAKPAVENGGFGVGVLPIELLTTTTSTGGGGDDFVVEADVLAVVLATLPAELRPRTARQRMQMAADIARWMGAGWTAAGIGQRARQGLKPGQVKYPDKLLAQLIPPEPPGPTGIVSSRPPARCPEHLADEPCRGCVIDRQLAERAAVRGAS